MLRELFGKDFDSNFAPELAVLGAVARAILGDPSIVLASELTENLDSANGEAVMDLMAELHRGGATICIVTHDPRYATYADRSISLFDVQVVEEEKLATAKAKCPNVSKTAREKWARSPFFCPFSTMIWR